MLQAFEAFDSNKDGHLNSAEFSDALMKCGINDLSQKEIEVLIQSVDNDRDGRIAYKEFARKLERFGLRNLSPEEMLVYNIIKTLRRLKMSKSELFKFINKDGEGLVTRKDLRDILTTLEMKNISETDIEKFIDYFYKEEKGGIDLRSFLRIFEKYERQIDQEERPGAAGSRRRARASAETIKTKKMYFEQIDFALKKNGVSLQSLFRKVD